MSIQAYEDWVARRASPGFQRKFQVAEADTVELPAIMVSEDEAAADTIRRYLNDQQRNELEEIAI